MNRMTPKVWLHTEGALVLCVSIFGFVHFDGSWLWFAVLILSPDVFMLGYAVNARVGAAVYNVVHTYVGPLLAIAYMVASDRQALLWLPFIWTAHIGMDRMFGFGLKYPTAFKDTHLHRV